ncbi:MULTISPECIES: LuxR C-terminal-related transcriptional regulator [unclassified Oscillibacter]|uniref:LuxR C-terminal-related transcriptional regulator n=1 Tax=unclassified Oscillibacter TaxID=2629304 RepID=UPI0026010AB0|nr:MULTISPECIES: LuxR C-terminal-related transcriptional regulator [unclassified Oscillibacter]
MSDIASVIIKPSLEEIFLTSWEHCRVILFAAPCGCGKTTTATALLSKHNICLLNAADAEFSQEDILRDCDTVLVDDLQYLLEPVRREALCELIRTQANLHFVLLGRGPVPGWLMPFQFAGIMLTIDTLTLNFDRQTAQRMLDSRGITISPEEMSAIQRDLKGYPIAMDILCRKLKDGAAYSAEIFDAIKRELFIYFEEVVYQRFEPPLRRLLISLAPFESFHLELAKMVSGNPRTGELLGIIQRDTTMLQSDGLDTYRFWPIFRGFLMWELHQKLTDAEQRILYSRAALYYELHDELDRALECYSLAGEQSKVSALLVKNAEQHPGIGYYHELQNYYFALPRQETLKSPSLMCGMSMLTAMCLDYEASERWYSELQGYAARLKKTDSEYKSVQGKLAYLDIALPQRVSRGLIEVVGSVFHVMTDKQLKVPSFSVTSTLPSIMNGGKDFCEWSKKDDLLYATMRKPLETVLGRDGVGLADCGICESKFEKGEDVSKRLLTLMSRLGEIQARGTPDIEFAVVGLLARVQVSQGKAQAALESIESLRTKFLDTGQTRFLPNIDAALCRIYLRLGDTEAARMWLQEKAPKNDARLWAMWRYQYLTRVMVQLTEGEYDDALLLLARLWPYCEYCGRVMDGIHIRLLSAMCMERMGNTEWKTELCAALDTCFAYQFIWPVAQYGAAILPLLGECGWERDAEHLEKLISAARAQAVEYPRFLKPQIQPVEPLSAAETHVFKLLCQNLSNQEIGEILGIKLPTVKTHVSRILQKLGVNRRSEAKAAAEKLRLL